MRRADGMDVQGTLSNFFLFFFFAVACLKIVLIHDERISSEL